MPITSAPLLLRDYLQDVCGSTTHFALIPVVTVYGTSLIAIFGVAVQTEKVFSLPGMGSTIADSALSQDAPVVLGLAIVVISFGAIVNLIVDLSYALIDPRIKIDSKAVH